MSNGAIVVDKPAGMTSAAVVAVAKRTLGAKSIGHTGTLDPMATGVLPLVLGEGTKLAQFLLADDKGYEGELELGVTTDTLDVEGKVTDRRDPSGVTVEALAAAVAGLVGPLKQIPPMYSALRRDGQRLHELARQGVELELEPRDVRVDSFELLGVTLPHARFRVACSKGTYVRSLVRDVGQTLGCGAMLTALRRTRAGQFTLADAVPLENILGAPVISPAALIAHLPTLTLDAHGREAARHGRPLPLPAGMTEGTIVRLLTDGGALAAIAVAKGDRLAYLRVFHP
jgi:tRNA pseudouridine55 synthase